MGAVNTLPLMVPVAVNQVGWPLSLYKKPAMKILLLLPVGRRPAMVEDSTSLM